jgi:hypothetical protein
MKKIAILLCLLLLVPALFIPGAAAGSGGGIPAYLCPQPPCEGEEAYEIVYNKLVGGVPEVGLYVHFKNCGPYAVDNAKATITSSLNHIYVVDGVVELGDIGPGEYGYSCPDLFVIQLLNPAGPPEMGLEWLVEYDFGGTHFQIPGVDQICETCPPPGVPYVYEPSPKLHAVEYCWGGPPSLNFPYFTSSLIVRIENRGDGDAYNVTATAVDPPGHTTIIEGDVSLGDIPVGCSAWSGDTFTIQLNLLIPDVDPCEGISWDITYEDADGDEYTIEGVPQFPPGESPYPMCNPG